MKEEATRRRSPGTTAPLLLCAAAAILTASCGSAPSIELFTIPSDYLVQTADLHVSATTDPTPQAAWSLLDRREFLRERDRFLLVVQLKNYQSDSALRCYDEQERKLAFVGTLVRCCTLYSSDLQDAGKSPDERLRYEHAALIAREMQAVSDEGSVAYVFSAPKDTTTVVVGSFGKRQLWQASPYPPSVIPEFLKIRKLIAARD